jgi:hypothetical protein
MAQRPSFDITKLSTAAKILLGAGILYFIDLLLAWNRKCISGFGCGTLTGWHGIGVLCGILVIALLAWEGALVAGVRMNIGTVQPGLVSAGIAGLLLLFTILRVLIKPSVVTISVPVFIFGWIGLILSLVIAYGGYMRYVEPAPSSMTPPPPPSPGTGGPTP